MTNQTLVLSPAVEGSESRFHERCDDRYLGHQEQNQSQCTWKIQSFASESGRVRDKVYSRHDAIRFPIPSSTSSPCFVVHSFRDCSDESCSFAKSEKLFFWSHHFEPVEMFAPAVYCGSLCAGRASCQGSNLLRIQLLWSFFVFFWNGHIHSNRFLTLHPSRKVYTSTRHCSADTELICWVNGPHY